MLKAIDQGCCFTCEAELTPKLSNLDIARDDCLYGLFPEFRSRIDRQTVLQAVSDAEAIQQADVEAMIAAVPRDWEVSEETRRAWCDLICRRAGYVRQILNREWPPETLFDPAPSPEGQP